MNIRLENDTLRFRVNARELDQLLANGSISGVTPLPGGSLRYGIELIEGDHWSIIGDSRHLVLHIPRLDVIGHKAELPSKQGLERTLPANGGVLLVCFEVDVKKAKA